MHHAATVEPQVGFLVYRFEDGHNKDQDAMKEMWAWSKDVLWDHTSIEPHFYYDHDDPNVIVAVVGWQSLESHFQELHKSELFRDVLAELGGHVEVRSNYHANIDADAIKAVTKGEGLIWTRSWVLDKHEAEFAKSSTRLSFDKSEGRADRPYASGWRITAHGWNEDDAFDYYEKYGDSPVGPSAPNGITEEELREMNEMVQLVGLDKIRENEPRTDGLSIASSNIKLVKFKLIRRLVKMDLHHESESEEETDGSEEGG